MSEKQRLSGRIAGIDFGTVRIGLALSDPAQTIASPYQNYTRRGLEADAKFFCKFAEEEQIASWVVGLPVHMSGAESEKSRQAQDFGAWLLEVTKVPVDFFDERLTTAQAEQYLLDAQLSRKKRKKRRDMLAAQIILASFLESSRRQKEDHQPLED